MLGDIGEDYWLIRYKIIQCGGLDKLLNLLNMTEIKTLITAGIRAMASFTRGNFIFQTLEETMKFLTKFIVKDDDLVNLTNVTISLCNISKGNEELMFQCMIESGCLIKLISLLKSEILMNCGNSLNLHF